MSGGDSVKVPKKDAPGLGGCLCTLEVGYGRNTGSAGSLLGSQSVLRQSCLIVLICSWRSLIVQSPHIAPNAFHQVP